LPCHNHILSAVRRSFAIFLACILLFPVTAGATLQPLENEELEEVTGQAGIGIGVKDVQIFQNIGQLNYCATDSGYLSLTNVQSDVIRYNFGTDLAGGAFYIDAGICEVASMDDWDLGTDPTSVNKGMLVTKSPDWQQEVSYETSSINFSSDGTGTNTHNLGAFYAGQIRQPSWRQYMAPHESGHGLDMEYDFEMHIDKLSYAYRIDSADPSNVQTLSFENIHIGQSFGFGTAGDDPSDPTTWRSDIGEFQIGDMFGDLTSTDKKQQHARPAQIDAGVCDFDFLDENAQGAYRLRLPFEGSIRFEKVAYGGTDFGPGAIDGIKAYRFDAYLIP